MSRKLLVGTVLLSAGILVAVFSFNRPSSIDAYSVAEFLVHPIHDQRVRLEGTLVPGSLCWRATPCEYRFRLVGSRSRPMAAAPAALTAELPVRYSQCIVPDTFRDGSGASIIVEGEQCASCHRFEASVIFARSHGKYEFKANEGAAPTPAALPPPLCTGS